MRFLILLLPFLVVAQNSDTSLLRQMMIYTQPNEQMRLDMLSGEFGELREAISAQRKEPQYTILYFFSASIPEGVFVKRIEEIALFNQNRKHKLLSSQSLIGMTGDLKKYLLKAQERAKRSGLDQEMLVLVDIRMSPEVFENLEIKEVPVMALSKCVEGQHPSECEVLSLIRGNVTLGRFFELLKEKKLLPEELQ
jgi:hypothetical protein